MVEGANHTNKALISPKFQSKWTPVFQMSGVHLNNVFTQNKVSTVLCSILKLLTPFLVSISIIMEEHGNKFEISENKIKETISNNIRIIRRFKGLTLRDVGKIVNTTHQQVQKYETGKSLIPVHKLFLLSSHLDLPISFFLTEFELIRERN